MPDETSATLRTYLLNDTTLFRINPAEIRVDNAPGFIGLENDPILKQHGITLDYGRVKNRNKTAVVDKGIQEFEQELLKVVPGIKQITQTDLLTILATLNQRIRFSGLSAREILLQREQVTGQQLSFSDKKLSEQQHSNRERNHLPSALSKAKGGKPASKCDLSVGTLVYIKTELDKFNARPMYIISALIGDHAKLQKFVGNQLSSKRHIVPLTQIFPVSQSSLPNDDTQVKTNHELSSDSDSELELGYIHNAPPHPPGNNTPSDSEDTAATSSEADEEDSSDEDAAEHPAVIQPARSPRPQRQRQVPQWHNDYDMSRQDPT